MYSLTLKGRALLGPKSAYSDRMEKDPFRRTKLSGWRRGYEHGDRTKWVPERFDDAPFLARLYLDWKRRGVEDRNRRISTRIRKIRNGETKGMTDRELNGLWAVLAAGGEARDVRDAPRFPSDGVLKERTYHVMRA